MGSMQNGTYLSFLERPFFLTSALASSRDFMSKGKDFFLLFYGSRLYSSRPITNFL